MYFRKYEGTKIDLRVFVVYNVRVRVHVMFYPDGLELSLFVIRSKHMYSTFESTFVLSKVHVLSKIEYFRTCNDYTRTCTTT